MCTCKKASSIHRIQAFAGNAILVTFLWSLLSAGLLPVPAQAASPRKLALLVAVNKYYRGQPKDFYDLNTQQDVQELRQVLIDKFQFPPENITVLTTPEETTKQSIITAFRTHLIDQVRKDDIVVFHYSGHGDQALDDNGDEFDGLDETLVPSDYVSMEDFANHIRDDELNVLLEELKAKEPASIALFIDSCHSGTATRNNPYSGRLRVRGRGWSGPPPKARTRGKEKESVPMMEQSQGLAEGYVLITAARPNQTAKEKTFDDSTTMGVFTHHLLRTLRTISPSTTYRDLFERLNYSMSSDAREQNPQMEGDIDTRVLEGTAVPQPRYVQVQRVRGDVVTLAAGGLHGVTQGSKYGLYRAGTNDFTSPDSLLVEVEVVRVRSTYCVAQLPPDQVDQFTEEELATARAVETQHNYGENRLKVELSSEVSRSAAPVPLRAVRDRVTGLAVAELRTEIARGRGDGDAAAWDVRIRADGGQYILERHDGSVIAAIDAGDEQQTLDAIQDALEGEARYRMLVKLENAQSSASVQVDLRLVKVEVEKDEIEGGVTYVKDLEMEPEAGELVLQEGDFVRIELRNRGNSACYVTVLDLSPDGTVNPIWPHPQAQAYVNENILAAGEEKSLFNLFRLGAPFGTEIFKAIATQRPTNFSPLLDERTREDGVRGAGDKSPLGRLLEAAVSNTRGTTYQGSISSDAWATAAVVFEIREAGRN